jgi:hypothetical protein
VPHDSGWFAMDHPPMRLCAQIGLLLVDEARAAGLIHLEVDVDFDAVGDFDEGDTAVDAVVFAVEGHGSFYGALAGPLAFDCHFEGFRLGDSPDDEVAEDVEGVRAGLDDPGRVEGDEGVLIDIEEIFALEFFVLDAASGANRGSLDFDVEDTSGDVAGGEGERGVPLVEVADKGDGGLDIELDGTVHRGGFEDWDLGAARCGQDEDCQEEEDGASHVVECRLFGMRCQDRKHLIVAKLLQKDSS